MIVTPLDESFLLLTPLFSPLLPFPLTHPLVHPFTYLESPSLCRGANAHPLLLLVGGKLNSPSPPFPPHFLTVPFSWCYSTCPSKMTLQIDCAQYDTLLSGCSWSPWMVLRWWVFCRPSGSNDLFFSVLNVWSPPWFPWPILPCAEDMVNPMVPKISSSVLSIWLFPWFLWLILQCWAYGCSRGCYYCCLLTFEYRCSLLCSHVQEFSSPRQGCFPVLPVRFPIKFWNL
jgi:hypothetical protein